MPMIIPTVIERWSQGAAAGYDIYSRLLKDRIIFVGGHEGIVTTDSANVLIAQMLYLESRDPKKDMHLYINSGGGSVYAGLAIYDAMQHVKPDVSTICVGIAASMGAIILSAGQKGKRYILPNAEVMIHQPLGGVDGQASDIAITAKHSLKTRENINKILSKNCAQPLAQIEKDV